MYYYYIEKIFSSAVIAAIISFIGVIINVRVSKRIAKESEETQKAIAKDNIDANIRRKNRLDFIEKIRFQSSELLSNSERLKFIIKQMISVSAEFMENTLLNHDCEWAESETEYEMDKVKQFKLRKNIEDTENQLQDIINEFHISFYKLKLLVPNDRSNRNLVMTLNDTLKLSDCLSQYKDQSIIKIYDDKLTGEDIKEFYNKIDDIVNENINKLIMEMQDYIEKETKKITELNE